MLLAEKATGHLVELADTSDLFNPFKPSVEGRMHFGEEPQDPEWYPKTELCFPSGEALPRCWLDPDYREQGAG